MRDYRDAKSMAHTLRASLADRGVSLSHTECLELIARTLGAKDWNVLSALIQDADPAALAAVSPAKATAGWTGPLIPCRDIVVFPRVTLPLFVGRETSIKALVEAERGELEVLLVTQKRREDDAPSPQDLYEIGVVADVIGVTRFHEEDEAQQRRTLAIAAKQVGEAEAMRVVESALRLTVRARQRARLISIGEGDGWLTAEATLIAGEAGNAAGAEAALHASLGAFSAFATGKEALAAPLKRAGSVAKPGVLADLIAQHAPGSIEDKQAILETLDPLERLRKAVALLPREPAQAA
jgi:ATP-dependent Lon protease